MNYRMDHIPLDTPNERRPGNPMTAETITIHNTANPRSTAKNERGWLTNPSNTRTASYHIVVDEIEAIECIPLTENAWHAGDGDGDGNRRSIGIEITESGNYTKTLENAATLVARMLNERGWGVDRLRRHYDWSKKPCPGKMYDNGTWAGWDAFKADVEQRMQSVTEETGQAISTQQQVEENVQPQVEPQVETKPETLTPPKVEVEGFRLADGVIIDGVFFPGKELANEVKSTLSWNKAMKTVQVTTIVRQETEAVVVEG